MKEVIIAECDGSNYIHCCRYEQTFDYVKGENKDIWKKGCGDHFEVIIFTSKLFPQGKVKITIETVKEE